MKVWSDWPIKRVRLLDKNLFYRGNFAKKIFKKSIAIVGSRRMTRYGKDVIEKFVSSFVANKVTTISGFMYGVDTEVHEKTVEFGGKTVAVFGCGLDVIYPPENEKLYGQILESMGLAISEYGPKAKPHLWKFPQRNRIVAGLASLGVLVIEAGEKSGALITAEIAKKLKKKVYAVPGPVNSSVSQGANELIKSGDALLVTGPEDIIAMSEKRRAERKKLEISGLEKKIYEVLKNEPLNIDEISASVGENVIEVGRVVSLMSLKDLVLESSGKFYVRQL